MTGRGPLTQRAVVFAIVKERKDAATTMSQGRLKDRRTVPSYWSGVAEPPSSMGIGLPPSMTRGCIRPR